MHDIPLDHGQPKINPSFPTRLVSIQKACDGERRDKRRAKKFQRNGCSPPCCLRHQAGFLYPSSIPLNTTTRVKKPTGLGPFCRWLVPHRARGAGAGVPSPLQPREVTLPPLPVMDAPVPKGTQLNYELALTRSEGSGLCFH